ncbi:MAG: N-acetylmuramoyl-L-alanine amidase [Flammeovirgaceae bacterium]
MKFEKIPAHEKGFKDSGKGLQGRMYNLKEFSVPVPNEELLLQAVSCRPADGDTSYYYDQTMPKKKVVVHFTAGYLKSDIFYLTKKNNKVSVAFVIGRDGIIYNLFHSGKWSYHLGRGSVGGNGTNSKASIGIELSNIGPLKRIGDNLVTVYSDSDVYCTIEDKDQYVEIENDFRGYTYFAAHTDAQYKSLAILLRYLTAKYDIPRAFLDEPLRYETNEQAAGFEGIVTHINFRKSGKWDLGPGFDWKRLIADVTGDGANLRPETLSRGMAAPITEDQLEDQVVVRTRGVSAPEVDHGEEGPDVEERLVPMTEE